MPYSVSVEIILNRPAIRRGGQCPAGWRRWPDISGGLSAYHAAFLISGFCDACMILEAALLAWTGGHVALFR